MAIHEARQHAPETRPDWSAVPTCATAPIHVRRRATVSPDRNITTLYRHPPRQPRPDLPTRPFPPLASFIRQLSQPQGACNRGPTTFSAPLPTAQGHEYRLEMMVDSSMRITSIPSSSLLIFHSPDCDRWGSFEFFTQFRGLFASRWRTESSL